MKTVVTGASGFLGNVLCRKLKASGHEVRAQYFSQTEALKGMDLELVRADVLDPEAMKALVRGAEVVFHLAGKISISGDPDGSVHRINEQGTRNLIEACLETSPRPRLIFFSSIHAFSTRTKHGIIDESASLAGPEASAYDHSKANSQRMVEEATKKGLDTVIVNPTGVYGPWDFQPSLFGQMLLDLYHGKVPALVKGGYDFVDVRDVIDTSIRAMTAGKSGEAYILSGHSLQISALAQLIAEESGKPVPKITLPLWVARLGLPVVQFWCRLRGLVPPYTRESLSVLSSKEVISGEKARRELGHSSRPPRESLRDFYQWAQEHGYLKD